jgi:hypothetical protein
MPYTDSLFALGFEVAERIVGLVLLKREMPSPIQPEAEGAEVIVKCQAWLYDLLLENLKQRRSRDLNVEAGAA